MKSTLEAIHDLDRTYDALIDDVKHTVNAVRASRIGAHRRHYVRSVFAFVEGFVFQMKQVAVAAHKDGFVQFTSGDLALLVEVSYDLDDRGEVRRRPANLPFANNARFGLTAFGRALAPGYSISFSDSGWETLRRAAKVRNRITHPKSVDDLTIADEELRMVGEAHRWFAGTARSILGKALSHLESIEKPAQPIADLSDSDLGKT
jgi:hypothetical protein